MNLKEWLSEKEFSFHRIETLVALIIMAGLILMQVVIPFINNYSSNIIVHLSIFLAIYISITGYWYYNRSVFPKNKNSKQHIIIAIITENAKQKTRITNDFSSQIKRLLIECGLDVNYDITVLHNHQARIIQNRIDLFSQSLRANLPMSEDVGKFNKLTKRLNAKFIIHGDLIKRNPENSTYCLSIEATMLHQSTSLQNGQSIHEEFKKLWNKEITFLEKEELTGFKANAEQIFFTASYMLGLATFVDNNYIQGIKIWEGLETYINTKLELSSFAKKVNILKSTSYFLQSRFLYFNGQIEEALIFRNKYLELTPNIYDKYLTEAINQIKLRNDPELSFDFAKKAELVAPNSEGTWRYSQFYLLIRLSRCEEALQMFDNILKINFPNELDTINQVLSYNSTCLNEDPSHIQSHFIIGALTFKKLNHPIPAYERLEQFVILTSKQAKWKPFQERAISYLAEIDIMIGVNK
jgi:tetratricopeptide (TPR) repeat protein